MGEPPLRVGLGGLLFIYMNFMGFPNVMAGWSGGSGVVYTATAAVSLALFILAKATGVLGREGLEARLRPFCGLLVLAAFLVFTWLSPSKAGMVLVAMSAGPAALLTDGALSSLLPSYHETGVEKPERRIRMLGIAILATGVVFIFLTFASVLSLTWAHVPGAENLKDMTGTIAVVGAALSAFPYTNRLFRKEGEEERGVSRGRFPARRAAIVAVAFLPVLATAVGGAAIHGSYAVEQSGPGNVTVMTYNIHQGYGMDGKLDPWEILRTVQERDPDILFLQESDCNRISSMNTDIVGWLAEKLGMYSYSGPSTGEQIYGVATLSRFPLENCNVRYLKSVEDQRVVVRCEVTVNGTGVALYNIHMGLNDADRENQTAEMYDLLRNETHPVILGGDFNSWPNSTYMENFTSYLDDTWELLGRDPESGIVYTFDSPEPHERIDYILVSKDLPLRVTDAGVMRGQYGSDHLPYWTEMRSDSPTF